MLPFEWSLQGSMICVSRRSLAAQASQQLQGLQLCQGWQRDGRCAGRRSDKLHSTHSNIESARQVEIAGQSRVRGTLFTSLGAARTLGLLGALQLPLAE